MNLTERAEKAFVAYNNHDLSEMREMLADDAVRITPEGTQISGIDAIVADAERLLTGFPDAHIGELRLTSSKDGLVEEFTWHGTNTGPTVLPDGTEIDPTGMEIAVRCCVVLETNDAGQVTVERQYWDNLGPMAQMGIIPSA